MRPPAPTLTLQPLVQDVFGSTNRLEGFLNAELVVTHANSALTNDFQGYGKADLRDGFLWDLPIFGVLTPVLNGISPGLGNSRASSAVCTFTIENAVVKSRDLVIRAEGMRLRYSGGVDLEGRTDARSKPKFYVTCGWWAPWSAACLAGDENVRIPGDGTLGNPELEPVYILPKLMRIPLQPFRSLKGLLPESQSGRTMPPRRAKTTMTELTNARVRQLKAQAQRLKASLKVGKEGLSPAFLAALNQALQSSRVAQGEVRRPEGPEKGTHSAARREKPQPPRYAGRQRRRAIPAQAG